jgi:hypoxanthine phosphoribosyltransferase
MKKYWYDWKEMRRDVNSLCREIVLDNFNPDIIVGISRGGLVPGIMMSHWFKKPFHPVKASLRDFPEWETYLPRPQDKKILIVDDICDSGETFKRIKDSIDGYTTSTSGKQLADVRFASLWWNNEVEFEPHYYAQEMAKDSTQTWIHFPWEAWWNAPV